MLKNILILLVASILAIFIFSEISLFMHYLVNWHTEIYNYLGNFLSGGYAATIIRSVIALLIIPLVVALVPAFLYWLFTKRSFPLFAGIMWFIWLLLVAALALQAK